MNKYLKNIHQQDHQLLIDCYSQSHRHYHNLDHIYKMLDYLSYKYENSFIMSTAVWFHDSVYDPTKHDNEEKSVELFKASRTYKQFSEQEKKLIIEMILATKDHAKGFEEHHNVEIVADFLYADLHELYNNNLSIARTIEIEKSIFKEYGFVPFEIYKKERLKILEKLKEDLHVCVDSNINFLTNYKPKIGLFCGSFNPIHKGHYRIIERAEPLFDKIIIARGVNPDKIKSLDKDVDDEFIRLRHSLPYHETVFYSDFQYDLIKRLQKFYDVTLIKAIRNEQDFQYEKNNNNLNDLIGVKSELKVETLYILAEPEFDVYSSSAIRYFLSTSKREIGLKMMYNPNECA